VVRDDEIVWAAGVGWADRERRIRTTRYTVFQLASVAKTVTCAGIMALVEDGLIDLDEDINSYLPFEVHVPHAPADSITMRTLLTHTSAIRDRWQVWGTPWSDRTLYFHGDSPISLGDFCRSYFVHGGSRYRRRKNFYGRAPGSSYAYSNLATALAGFVAESASGVDFDELCKQRICEPLGMTNSGFRLADIDTTNLAMPYATVSHGDLEPIFHYGCPDYPDGAFRDERHAPGEMARCLHEPRGVRGRPGVGRVDGPGDPAQPDPRSRRLASRADLVRAEAVGLLHVGTHRR
jgi:CubicO group peptidase (beta-lactamase class C family)